MRILLLNSREIQINLRSLCYFVILVYSEKWISVENINYDQERFTFTLIFLLIEKTSFTWR